MFVLKKGFRSGFTLIEIVFTMTLVVILAGLSLWTLQPAKNKAPTQGLAIALSEEFEAARQLAIANGRPIALGIPTDEGATAVASSVYRLEGWNKPIVTSSKGFQGDYPNTVFLAAGWPGPSFTHSLGTSALSKFFKFDLDTWLPKAHQNDYIFCFLPDGGLITNNLPALDGRYTVVVAEGPTVSGAAPNKREVTGANSAFTLFISPSGGVELVVGMPGGPSPGSGSGSLSSSKPQARTEYGGKGATVKISQIRILPNPATAPPDQGVCVPGQVVTLEVYAYDPEGRALFSKWTQVAENAPQKGQFSYPYSNANPALAGEVDKMEFVYDYPNDLTWTDNAAPPQGVGVFRARWNWTVPITSQPGHRYKVQADVRDVKGEVYIKNPPEEVLEVPPSGRMLVERLKDGVWQLVLMNPDGSGEKVLSPAGVEEVMPSLDRSGTKMAFLQGKLPNRSVKVRSLHGGPETTLDGPGPFVSISMSPDGAWVSYRRQGDEPTPQNGTLITKRLDGGQTYSEPQSFMAGSHRIKKSRSGWSQDSRYMLFEGGSSRGNLICSQNLATGAIVKLLKQQFHNSIPGYNGPEIPFAPTSYTVSGGERVLVSLGNNNPVLVSFFVPDGQYGQEGEIDPGDLYTQYPSNPTGSKLRVGYGGNGGGADNDYPSISSDGQFLVFTQSPQTSGDSGYGVIEEDLEDQKLWIIPRNQDNFIMGPGGPTIVSEENVRRAIWLPSE